MFFDDEEEAVPDSGKKKVFVLDSEEEVYEEDVFDAENYENEPTPQEKQKMDEERKKKLEEKKQRKRELKENAKRNQQLQLQTQLLGSVEIPKKVPKKVDVFSFAQKLVDRLQNVNSGRFVPEITNEKSTVFLTADVECGVNVDRHGEDDDDELIVVAEEPKLQLKRPGPRYVFGSVDDLDMIMNEANEEKIGDIVIDRTKVWVAQLPAFFGVDLWSEDVTITYVTREEEKVDQKKEESDEDFRLGGGEGEEYDEEEEGDDEEEAEEDEEDKEEEEEEDHLNIATQDMKKKAQFYEDDLDDFELDFSEEKDEQQNIGQMITDVVKSQKETQVSQKSVIEILQTPRKKKFKEDDDVILVDSPKMDEEMDKEIEKSEQDVDSPKMDEEMDEEIEKSEQNVEKKDEEKEEKEEGKEKELEIPKAPANRKLEYSSLSPLTPLVTRNDLSVSNERSEVTQTVPLDLENETPELLEKKNVITGIQTSASLPLPSKSAFIVDPIERAKKEKSSRKGLDRFLIKGDKAKELMEKQEKEQLEKKKTRVDVDEHLDKELNELILEQGEVEEDDEEENWRKRNRFLDFESKEALEDEDEEDNDSPKKKRKGDDEEKEADEELDDVFSDERDEDEEREGDEGGEEEEEDGADKEEREKKKKAQQEEDAEHMKHLNRLRNEKDLAELNRIKDLYVLGHWKTEKMKNRQQMGMEDYVDDEFAPAWNSIYNRDMIRHKLNKNKEEGEEDVEEKEKHEDDDSSDNEEEYERKREKLKQSLQLQKITAIFNNSNNNNNSGNNASDGNSKSVAESAPSSSGFEILDAESSRVSRLIENRREASTSNFNVSFFNEPKVESSIVDPTKRLSLQRSNSKISQLAQDKNLKRARSATTLSVNAGSRQFFEESNSNAPQQIQNEFVPSRRKKTEPKRMVVPKKSTPVKGVLYKKIKKNSSERKGGPD